MSKLNFIDRFHIWRRKQRWNRQYKSGRWDNLKGEIESIRYQTIVAFIKKHAIENPSILDLGCGEGIMCEHLQDTAYNNFLGMDFSNVSIEKAKKLKFKNADFICADLHNFKPQNTYDVIVFNEVFYYIHDAKKHDVLMTMISRLNDDGIVICSMFREHKQAWTFFDNNLTQHTFETVKTEEENKFWQIGVYKK